MTESAAPEDGEEEVPSYILPIFFTAKTQEIFNCRCDEDVTEENPYKLITKEQINQDFKDRAAICDFHPAKDLVLNFPDDELLVVYDAAFKYGQNFYIITTVEQKNLLLTPVSELGELDEMEEGGEEVVEVRRGLRTPKPWISLGSENEVIEELVTEARLRVTYTISRKRREFGTSIFFEDRNNDETKDSYIECPPYEDESYATQKKEMDYAIQHVAVVHENSTQTDWPCPRNANTQYVPREYTSEENDTIMQSSEIQAFITNVAAQFEHALQQNDTMNLFVNDYLELGEEDNTFGSKSDNHLKEYQSFTDLQFSKNKTISSIQWHPKIKGLIAVSCMEHMTFYERVDQASKCLMMPSLILIWSFADPIHPLLMLEGPDDILCFEFNPSDPNIICGGCINGQIVLWDITKFDDRLKNHRNHSQGSQPKQNLANMPAFFDTDSHELSPMIRYCAVSNIESSHKMAISDIQWVPDHMEIGRMGVVVENKSATCNQLITCSTDGSVIFWDTRPPSKSGTGGSSNMNIDELDGTPSNQFKHLDLSWKPLLKTTVQRLRGTGDYSPLKFSISEVQGPPRQKKSEKEELEQQESVQFNSGGFGGKKKDTDKELKDISTKFYTVTEDGELVYLDWRPTKDIDTGKVVSPKPELCTEAHDGPIQTIQKSPFFNKIFLTVGGWSFSIWKEGVTLGPLFQSYAHECKLTSAYWSPSRPGVFFIGRSDGCVDVWDFLDKTHEPFLTQNVTSSAVVKVFPYQISGRQQLVAVGDEIGTLHIMEVPWNLRHPSSNEVLSVENYLERESNRLTYVEGRQKLRTQEKSRKDGDKTAAQDIPLDDAEWELKARVEYEKYLEMERKILETLLGEVSA